MHLYYLAIFPVTALIVAGYVTLYCANGSQGKMRTFGKIISAWAFLLAIAVAAAAVFCPALGERHMGMMHEHYMHGMMNGAEPHGPPPGAPETPDAPLPMPAAPATPQN